MVPDNTLRRMLTFVCVQLICFYQVSWGENNLLDELLEEYNLLERPVLNASEPILVNFNLALIRIIDVDEKNQILITNSRLSMEWIDHNLQWDPPEYDNVSKILIHPHRIWRPDILMYNSADAGFDAAFPTNVVVRSNGRVTYNPPGIFKSTCDIDVTWFPFNEQKCIMKFGSWSYDSGQLDLEVISGDGGAIRDYNQNVEWSLKGFQVKRSVSHYSGRPDAYVDITFEIHLQRRTLYYLMNLMVPFVVITSMAILGFALTPDSRERLYLGVTILVSMTVFCNRIAAALPVTSDSVPLLGIYFNGMMFIIAASVVSTIVILNFHFRDSGTHETSRWVRIIFLEWFPWLLRIHTNIPEEMPHTSEVGVQTCDCDLHLKETNITKQQSGLKLSRRELSLIFEEVRLMTKTIGDVDVAAEINNEWKFIALVIDRLCLIFFTSFTIIATIAVLTSAPQILLP